MAMAGKASEITATMKFVHNAIEVNKAVPHFWPKSDSPKSYSPKIVFIKLFFAEYFKQKESNQQTKFQFCFSKLHKISITLRVKRFSYE